MKKYAKSSASRYLKLITTSYPNGSRTRYPSAVLNDSIKHREFKLVLPMIPRDTVSGKGSNLKPEYDCLESMNVMIQCLKNNDYVEAACQPQVNEFLACFNKFTTTTKLAVEQARKGVYEINENQRQFPFKFMQQMFQKYKTLKKVDNGPAIPIK